MAYGEQDSGMDITRRYRDEESTLPGIDLEFTQDEVHLRHVGQGVLALEELTAV